MAADWDAVCHGFWCGVAEECMSPGPSPASRLAALALPVLLALSVWGRADENVGPPIGRNGYKAHIEPGPDEPDVDDFVASLFAGEQLSVTVISGFQSPLIPQVELLDPTGADRSDEAGLGDSRGRKKLRVKRFPIDVTGQWTVRISGLLETEGPFTVTFKVGTPGKAREKKLSLGGSAGDTRDHTFESVGGALLDVKVTSKRATALVTIDSVRAPSGAEALDGDGNRAADLVVTKRRKAELEDFELPAADGLYAVRVATDAEDAGYDLTVRVVPQGRPKSKRVVKLPSAEPFLDAPPQGLVRGVEDDELRLTGRNLSTDRAPLVLIGEFAAREVVVDPSGGFLDCVVPPGPSGVRVPVTIINPDLQAHRLPEFFLYVPPPEIESITLLDGTPITGGSTEGGLRVRLRGTNFASGQLIRFGEGPLVIPILRGPELEFSTPAGPAGFVKVVVFDTFGHQVESPFDFEYKLPPMFLAEPYLPAVAPADGGREIVVRGISFEPTDIVLFNGSPIAHTHLGSGVIRFEPPAAPDGFYVVEIEDRFGLRTRAPDLRIKPVGVIDTIAAIDGARIGADEVSRHGGARVRLDGESLDAHDVVALAGVAATTATALVTRLEVVTAAADPGLVDVVVTDAAGQAVTVAAALRVTGAADATGSRMPGRGDRDDFSALRGAAGDVDGDGDADDLVIVSAGSAPGTRTQRLRVLFGGSTGALSDVTATSVPATGSDSSGLDDWSGRALALGDVDDDGDLDVLVAGVSPDANDVSDLRVMLNDGDGGFALDEDVAPASTYAISVDAQDEDFVLHEVFGVRTPSGAPTSLALGDLDGDGDLDVIVGRDRFESVSVGIDPAVVDFGATPPYVTAENATDFAVDSTRYFAATRILENRIDDDEGLVDVTESVLPAAGDAENAGLPAFHARDVALADLDGDDDLDLVLTWHDPTTVTASGLVSGTDTERVATRVLLNDGDGEFTDATSTWLPAGGSLEYFQAHRLALRDLDGDGDPDLVLAHAVALDAHLGTPHFNRLALRVLRNNHDPVLGTGGFVSVTALPALTLADDENLRADALVVEDLNGDGAPDILIGSVVGPEENDGAALRATRLLAGTPDAIGFARATDFLPAFADDSGEADEFVLVPDLAGNPRPSIVLIGETLPENSAGTRFLRVWDWER